MQDVFIHRVYSTNKQTLGLLYCIVNDFLFVAKTMELPNRNNERRVSCIPAGSYVCSQTYSPHFGKPTYELMNVPQRSAIRIHPANFAQELLGCIALGSALKDLNMDGAQDVIHSGNTCVEFEKLLNKEPFLLTIIDFTTLPIT